MAHFYGTLKGNRGKATRCGTKRDGMDTYTASWQGAVHCGTYHDHETGQDMVRVSLTTWRGEGSYRELYHGPISGQPRNELKEEHIGLLRACLNEEKQRGVTNDDK